MSEKIISDVIVIQIFAALRLFVSIYILFFWIPRKILPQEYINDRLDGVMFNLVHMIAIIVLVFPIFVFLKVFGLPFLLMFCFGVRLLFVKYWYKKRVLAYLGSELYHPTIMWGLIVLEKGRENLTAVRQWAAITWQRLRFYYNPLQLSAAALTGIVIFYAVFIRLHWIFTSMVAVTSDMYQYFYWNKTLKVNQLIEGTSGRSLPWGSEVFIFTTNMFANLDTSILLNIFALPILVMTFFTIFYYCRKLFDPEGKGTTAGVVAILVFGVIAASPWSEALFGTVFYATEKPDAFRILFFNIYSGARKVTDSVQTIHPFYFFLRYAAGLPYEMAASFFPINLYFLMKFFAQRSRLYLLLYCETLGIILAIHPGVAVPLFLPSFLIAGYWVLSSGMNWESVKEFLMALGVCLVVAQLWILQFFIYGVPKAIGAAAPWLDKLLGTEYAARAFVAAAVKAVHLVTPTILLALLALAATVLMAVSFFFRNKGKRFSLICVAFIVIATLILYGQQNWGLPVLVHHQRMLTFLSFAYALMAAATYRLLIEEFILRKVFKRWAYPASLTVMAGISLTVMIATPRWIDTKVYWDYANEGTMELRETPYLTFKIRETFPPFTYTVVAFVEEFSQVYGSGYHINTHDFITIYNPLDPELKIPTGFIFIFVENKPVTYRGSGEFWYRWRSEIMLKLKDWVAMYGTNHDNMKLWFSNPNLHVYVIDNRQSQDAMVGRIEKVEDKGR